MDEYLYLPPHNHQIPFNIVKYCHSWQMAPGFKAVFFEKMDARQIMTENKTEKVFDLKFWAILDYFFKQFFAEPFSLRMVCDIDTYLGSAPVSRATIKGLEACPCYNFTPIFNNPKRACFRVMGFKPGNPAFYSYRLQVSRNHPALNGFIVNRNNGREVVDDRIPDG